MATVSISEAARLTGKGRETLYRHAKAGKLSIGKDELGNPVIDTAELFRVYPKQGRASKGKVTQAQNTPKDVTARETPQAPAVDALIKQLEAAQEREAWLRQQLEASQEQCRELERRMLPPVQEKKDLWSRIFGK
jgi:hypothetical protein